MGFSNDVYRFMHAALQEAEKAFEINEVPVGSVVVYENKIIGRGYNQIERLNDATAHAEMIALTAASDYLSNRRLNECDLFVTLEPCIMCAGAMLLSRIKNLYFSSFDPKFGACGSVYNITAENKYNHKINVFSGIFDEESQILLKNFFSKVRSENKTNHDYLQR